MNTWKKTVLSLFTASAIAGCSSHPPMATVAKVDLDRYMGDWYVIANIPTPFEKNIYNAVENYERVEPNKIATTFSYNKGSFDGEKKVMRPTGFVKDDPSNALWGMQFLWPFKGDFRIVYLDPEYQQTIIARQKRDYVWIMARQPQISDSDYQKLVEVVKSLGYDMSKLQKIPQKWEQQL